MPASGLTLNEYYSGPQLVLSSGSLPHFEHPSLVYCHKPTDNVSLLNNRLAVWLHHQLFITCFCILCSYFTNMYLTLTVHHKDLSLLPTVPLIFENVNMKLIMDCK